MPLAPNISNFLIYGSYGYTGDLIARLAVKKGYHPTLGGRDSEKLNKQARKLGLECIPLSLGDPSEIDRVLANFSLVLHCAGPFSHTYDQMASACLRTQTHYLDITGEVAVFEGLAGRGREAAAAGVMLLPGIGFDVVATDCLAAHLKERLPEADHLALAFRPVGSRFSRGTASSAIERGPKLGLVRRDGRLMAVPFASETRLVDFGKGPVPALRIPWGDVSTAFYSTGIPNVEVFIALPALVRKAAPIARYLGGLLAFKPIQKALKNLLTLLPPGPSPEQRARGFTLLWGEVRDAVGNLAVSRARTPESYEFTSLAALAAVEKVLDGQAPPGFQTPSLAFGSGFLLEIEGCTREDTPVASHEI
jgi:short subunit dehydrogenase-like uncharacterized protein